MHWFCLLLIIGVLTGCTSIHTPTDFLPSSVSLAPGKYFKQEYIAPGTHFKRYRQIKIQRVSLGYFDNEEKIKEEELRFLALLLQKVIESRLETRFRIAAPGEPIDANTLVISPALVKVGGSYQLLDLSSKATVAKRDVGPGSGPFSIGSAIFEAKMTNGGTGDLVAFVAEKRTVRGKAPGYLGAKNILTNHPHAEVAFGKWGNQLRKMLQSR